MNRAEAYIPIDRRQSLTSGQELPEWGRGAALFVDISGFTPLTNALRRHYGARRGAEELTRRLNLVYTALICEIEVYGGSVIGFSGDAITCWFAQQAAEIVVNDQGQAALRRALAAALAVQQAMRQHGMIELKQEQPIVLAVKTAVTAGPARRFVVGDPAIQRIDVLAGVTIDRMAATEQMTQEGELVLDSQSVALIATELTIRDWRTASATGERYASIEDLEPLPPPLPWPSLPSLTDEEVRPWLLPAVAARLQSEQDQFLAELRPAAALFVKFTGLNYDHNQTAAAQLDRYIRWVQRIIQRYNGALIQLTTGDKGSYLYATFGAPVAHDDDIERAAAVAIALRSSPTEHPFLHAVQIGISYGTMRVGPYGSESRRTYGVLGNETNMAARYMTHAKAGQIVVGQVVADALAYEYELEPLGAVPIKGRTEPQQLFLITQPRNQPQYQQIQAAAPLVGRTQELRLLQAQAEQLLQGKGALVRVSGGAGLGKSHLIAHFRHAIVADAMRTIVGAGQSTAQDTAYFTMRQVLWALLELTPPTNTLTTAELAVFSASIAEMLTARNPGWALRLPLLGDLLGIDLPDNATTATFDARLRQEALVTLTAEIISHYAQERPLLLILEDVHWLDEASQGIVSALAQLVTTTPLLLLLIHRPATREEETFLRELEQLPEQHAIALEELPPDSLISLVESRLGGTITPRVASLIQVQTQGNPFFTEELVDALKENNQILLVDGLWQLAPGLTRQLRNAGCLVGHLQEERVRPDAPLAELDIGIPTTIQGIILARLDRLPEPVKLTVKVASVIGRLFDQQLLTHAHPSRPATDTLEQELATLLTREFARVEAPAPHASYLFKHNITQEVVYQTLLTDQRQALHQSVAKALEQLQPDRVEALAMHYYNSDLSQPQLHTKALHYLDAAGHRAHHDYANETALSYFNRALGLEQRATWLRAKVEILHTLGRREEERDTLSELTSADGLNQGQVELLWGTFHEALSEYDVAQQHVEQALATYQRTGDRHGTVQSYNQLGTIAGRQADYSAAQHYFQAALAKVNDDDTFTRERAALLYGLSIVNRQQGNYTEAQSLLETALDLHRQTGNRQGEARILTALGVIAHMQRDYQTAETFYRESLTIQRMIGDRTGEGGSLISLGQVARSREDWSTAAQHLLEGQQIFQLLDNRWWQSRILNELGVMNLITGNFVDAATHLNQSLHMSQAIGDAAVEAIALLNLGQVLREQGNNPAAIALHQQSIAIAEEQADSYLQAQNWSDLAINALILHQPHQAIKYANDALTTFRELKIESTLTTEQCTLAEAYLQLAARREAMQYVSEAFALLQKLGSEGPDYPHRDYWTCSRIFTTLKEPTRARKALTYAYEILQQKAGRISDPATRWSFLNNVSFNRQILTTARQQGLASATQESK